VNRTDLSSSQGPDDALEVDHGSGDDVGTGPHEPDRDRDPDPESMRSLPPFDPDRFRRLLLLDAAARWGVIVGVALAVVLASLMQLGLAAAAVIGVVAFLFAVAGGVTVSVHTLRDLAVVTSLLAVADQAERTESHLAGAVSRWPLPQWLRVLLVHRWAVLRHQQGECHETVKIATALLEVMTRVRQQAVRNLRNHTLLMLLEAQLQLEDLTGAYQTLLQLDRASLSQIERLQRLSLQTRYELMCGWPNEVVRGLERKVELAELMPAVQCGAMHAMLAQACTMLDRRQTANWLSDRAELLATNDQIEALLNSGSGIVGPPEQEVMG